MRILVLGGDGYVGWPLALRLLRRYPGSHLIIADNLARRRLVEEVGASSLTPIASPEERQRAVSRVAGEGRCELVKLDVSTAELDALVASFKPTHVYHLAQQPSGPYSMIDVERGIFTLQNNEVGNLRLLWAVRRHVPGAHIIKLGSFGEYARGAFDVAEGYFQPAWRGRTALRPLPYPRESGDIYHVSKINDSNYVSMACRKWGLSVTDIMQSTIFGAGTAESMDDPALCTRLDYDAVFGTCVHRFVAQIVSGHPMTVYGSGFQRTGLMALPDSIESLAALASEDPPRGRHRVVNHVTRDVSINELAENIAAIGREKGHHPEIHRGHDPRGETVDEGERYEVEASHVAANVRPTPFAQVVAPMFDVIARHKDRIDPAVFHPGIRW